MGQKDAQQPCALQLGGMWRGAGDGRTQGRQWDVTAAGTQIAEMLMLTSRKHLKGKEIVPMTALQANKKKYSGT